MLGQRQQEAGEMLANFAGALIHLANRSYPTLEPELRMELAVYTCTLALLLKTDCFRGAGSNPLVELIQGWIGSASEPNATNGFR